MKFTKDLPQTNSTEVIRVHFDPVNVCPRCHIGIDPSYAYGYVSRAAEYSDPSLYVTFICPSCKRPFLAHYALSESDDYALDGSFLEASPDIPVSDRHFSESLNSVSPRFEKIYNQSSLAEGYNLDEIAGVGYRKALEFLVKDYAISLHPDDVSQITKNSLLKVISGYIEHPRLQALAKASAWIGNDETHYVRKHEDYDIEGLKRFIDATVNFIENELIFSEAERLTSSNY